MRTQVEELQRVNRLRRFLSPQVAELVINSGDDSVLRSHRREIVVVSAIYEDSRRSPSRVSLKR